MAEDDHIQNCIDIALESLSHYTSDEIHDYVNQIFSRANDYRELGYGNTAAFDQAKDEVSQDFEKVLFSNVFAQHASMQRFKELKSMIDEEKADIGSLVMKRYLTPGDNIESAQHTFRDKLYTTFANAINDKQFEHFENNPHDVVLALDGKEYESPDSNAVAKAIKKLVDKTNSELIRTHAIDPDNLSVDRFLKVKHDPDKIRNPKKAIKRMSQLHPVKWDVKDVEKKDERMARSMWKNHVKNNFDEYKTAERLNALDAEGNVLKKKLDKALDTIYDNITTNKNQYRTSLKSGTDLDELRKRQKLHIVWKDWQAMREYNYVYGHGDLPNMVQSHVISNANRIGLHDFFGPSPSVMFNSLMDAQHKRTGPRSFKDRTARQAFDEVSGANQEVAMPTLNRITQNVKTLSSMARLGNISILSRPDIGYMSSFIHRIGGDYMEAWGHLITNMFDNVPEGDKQWIAKTMKSSIDSQIGQMGRFQELDNASEFLTKASDKYFKTLQMHRMDESAKMGAMHLTAKVLGRAADKQLGDMDAPTRHFISRFLSRDEWNAWREHAQDELLTLDHVNNIDRETLDQIRGEKSLSQAENDLYRRVHSMFKVAAQNAVLEPNTFERVLLHQGTSPGTPAGSLMRLFSHFHMYSTAYMDRVIHQGLKDSLATGKVLKWASAQMLGTIPLAYLATSLDYISQGQSVPSMIGPNGVNKDMAASVLAPSLAMYAGLLDSRNQNSDLITSSILGSPSLRLSSNALSSVMAGASGNFDTAKRNLEKALGYMLPINSVPFISPFIRQGLGQHRYIEPGQKQLFGQ